jgi:hypothetical protein
MGVNAVKLKCENAQVICVFCNLVCSTVCNRRDARKKGRQIALTAGIFSLEVSA